MAILCFILLCLSMLMIGAAFGTLITAIVSANKKAPYMDEEHCPNCYDNLRHSVLYETDYCDRCGWTKK